MPELLEAKGPKTRELTHLDATNEGMNHLGVGHEEGNRRPPPHILILPAVICEKPPVIDKRGPPLCC